MYRAALLFFQETGLAFSLRIAIEKHIPLGAGLGGGSSNAAAILGALNEAAGFPLSHDALMEAAARLGSDVPFFIEGKPAFVSGRGEHVAPFAVAKDLFFVLVKPAFASETAEAYRLLDERRSALQASGLRDSVLREAVSPETLIAALEKPPSTWPYRNDFQSVFLDDRHPHSGEYRKIFSALHGTGASFTLLSGSGSTVFGVYESKNAAEAAATAVASLRSEQGESRWGWPCVGVCEARNDERVRVVRGRAVIASAPAPLPRQVLRASHRHCERSAAIQREGLLRLNCFTLRVRNDNTPRHCERSEAIQRGSLLLSGLLCR